MIKIAMGILLIVALNTACTVTGGNLKVRVPGVDIGLEGSGGGGGGGGYHCPPGQAKKGNC